MVPQNYSKALHGPLEAAAIHADRTTPQERPVGGMSELDVDTRALSLLKNNRGFSQRHPHLRKMTYPPLQNKPSGRPHPFGEQVRRRRNSTLKSGTLTSPWHGEKRIMVH